MRAAQLCRHGHKHSRMKQKRKGAYIGFYVNLSTRRFTWSDANSNRGILAIFLFWNIFLFNFA